MHDDGFGQVLENVGTRFVFESGAEQIQTFAVLSLAEFQCECAVLFGENTVAGVVAGGVAAEDVFGRAWEEDDVARADGVRLSVAGYADVALAGCDDVGDGVGALGQVSDIPFFSKTALCIDAAADLCQFDEFVQGIHYFFTMI